MSRLATQEACLSIENVNRRLQHSTPHVKLIQETLINVALTGGWEFSLTRPRRFGKSDFSLLQRVLQAKRLVEPSQEFGDRTCGSGLVEIDSQESFNSMDRTCDALIKAPISPERSAIKYAARVETLQGPAQ
eukprot:2440732-Pyramimonas_sp.AAC.2